MFSTNTSPANVEGFTLIMIISLSASVNQANKLKQLYLSTSTYSLFISIDQMLLLFVLLPIITWHSSGSKTLFLLVLEHLLLPPKRLCFHLGLFVSLFVITEKLIGRFR